MELSRAYSREANREEVQLAVFELVGELLAVTLEKHEVEVVVDPQGFLGNQPGAIDDSIALQTLVECEDVVKGHRQLRITISGNVEKQSGLQEPFMLDFTIGWNQLFENIKRSSKEKKPGINTLWLQFSRKEEQFVDAIFTINIYRKEVTGQQFFLGDGEGFLVFNKENGLYLH